ncbi:11471_t:CDS:1, partial [Racocetra persica]
EDEVLRLLISKLSHMDRLSCQYIKKDGSTHMDHLSCQYIKKDGSICGKGCWRASGCAIHYKKRSKKLCLICNKLTNSYTGICSTHGRIYDRAWCENKKNKTESDVVKILS